MFGRGLRRAARGTGGWWSGETLGRPGRAGAAPRHWSGSGAPSSPSPRPLRPPRRALRHYPRPNCRPSCPSRPLATTNTETTRNVTSVSWSLYLTTIILGQEDFIVNFLNAIIFTIYIYDHVPWSPPLYRLVHLLPRLLLPRRRVYVPCSPAPRRLAPPQCRKWPPPGLGTLPCLGVCTLSPGPSVVGPSPVLDTASSSGWASSPSQVYVPCPLGCLSGVRHGFLPGLSSLPSPGVRTLSPGPSVSPSPVLDTASSSGWVSPLPRCTYLVPRPLGGLPLPGVGHGLLLGLGLLPLKGVRTLSPGPSAVSPVSDTASSSGWVLSPPRVYVPCPPAPRGHGFLLGLGVSPP